MPTTLRAGRGMTLWEKARLDPPAKKLELFSYENNLVRLVIRSLNSQISFFLYILTSVKEKTFKEKKEKISFKQNGKMTTKTKQPTKHDPLIIK